MANRLRDIFDPNSEYNKKLKERIERIIYQLVEDNSCYCCKNAVHPGHFEMGKYSGTDTYCRMTKELKKCSDTCLFYNYNEVFMEKHMEKLECEKCKYWNTEDCYCTWLSCDGLDCDEKLPCESEDKTK